MPLRDQAFSMEGRFGRAQLKAVIRKNKMEVFVSQLVETPHKLFI